MSLFAAAGSDIVAGRPTAGATTGAIAGVSEIADRDWAGAAVEWDRWAPPGHLCLSHRFLDCARHVQMDGYRMIPLTLAGADGKTLGVAVGYRSSVDVAELGDRRVQDGARFVRRLVPGFLKYQVIELGLPVGVGYPAHADASSVDTVKALANWAMSYSRRNDNALVVVRDIDTASAPSSESVLRELGFMPVPLPSNYVIALPDRSFEDYKARMRSPYRRRLEQHMKATAGLCCEVVEDFAALAPELAALWRGLYDRVGRYHRVVITERFLQQASGLEESRAVLLRRSDGSVAGFGLVYLDGEVLRYSSTGFTREAAREEGVYFRLLYEVVRLAIERGCTAASLGQSTAEPKLRVGGLPVAVQAWVWHRSGIKRRMLSRLTNALMKPPATAEARNVFREPAPPVLDPALIEVERRRPAENIATWNSNA
ncbi:GNAT family N-acetyltransferase [Lysobacter sp. CA199]|uniref:GNAT family N-acetyltransferase n=1 Tax=Lysobacter sp. CA199 TaxID=3455608 RepID=UPI003F8CF4D4